MNIGKMREDFAMPERGNVFERADGILGGVVAKNIESFLEVGLDDEK